MLVTAITSNATTPARTSHPRDSPARPPTASSTHHITTQSLHPQRCLLRSQPRRTLKSILVVRLTVEIRSDPITGARASCSLIVRRWRADSAGQPESLGRVLTSNVVFGAARSLAKTEGDSSEIDRLDRTPSGALDRDQKSDRDYGIDIPQTPRLSKLCKFGPNSSRYAPCPMRGRARHVRRAPNS